MALPEVRGFAKKSKPERLGDKGEFYFCGNWNECTRGLRKIALSHLGEEARTQHSPAVRGSAFQGNLARHLNTIIIIPWGSGRPHIPSIRQEPRAMDSKSKSIMPVLLRSYSTAYRLSMKRILARNSCPSGLCGFNVSSTHGIHRHHVKIDAAWKFISLQSEATLQACFWHEPFPVERDT